MQNEEIDEGLKEPEFNLRETRELSNGLDIEHLNLDDNLEIDETSEEELDSEENSDSESDIESDEDSLMVSDDDGGNK